MTTSQACFDITPLKQEVADKTEIELTSLNPAIARAIQEGWRIAPVSAHSKLVSLTHSCIEEPSNDPVQSIYRAFEYPNANWCVVTGHESRLAILEVDHETGQDALCDLCNDFWEGWMQTLRFQDDESTYFLFRYAGQRIRHLSSQYEGVKIHAGARVLLPTSWFVTGKPLRYLNSDAQVLGCPEWLLAPGESRQYAGNVIPFPVNPLRSIA